MSKEEGSKACPSGTCRLMENGEKDMLLPRRKGLVKDKGFGRREGEVAVLNILGVRT